MMQNYNLKRGIVVIGVERNLCTLEEVLVLGCFPASPTQDSWKKKKKKGVDVTTMVVPSIPHTPTCSPKHTRINPKPDTSYS